MAPPDRRPPQLTIAQRHAFEAVKETGGEYALVLIAKDGALVVGAWCPDVDVIKHLLRSALEQMDTGEATHLPVREGEPS